MTDFLKQHKILSLIVLLLLIGVAWWEFTGTSSPAPVGGLSVDTTLISMLGTSDMRVTS